MKQYDSNDAFPKIPNEEHLGRIVSEISLLSDAVTT